MAVAPAGQLGACKASVETGQIQRGGHRGEWWAIGAFVQLEARPVMAE